MAKRILVLIGIICSIHLNAQTGIGTTTPNVSAKLDVYSDNKGFLPPRVSLTGITDATTIPSPATGLLVYCKGDAGLSAGYYYWNGSAWATIATAGGSGSFAASFLRGSRIAIQTIAVDGSIIFTSTDASSGSDITLSSGKLTLAPGKTYRLISQVPNVSGGQRPSFMWYNETSSSYIGSASSSYNPGDNASLGASGGVSEVILSPNVTTILSYRLLSSLSSGSVTVGGNGDFSSTGSYPWFEAQVISGNAPVTGQSIDYISVQSSGQTVATGNTIKFQNTLSGNIPYNSSTGNFTLIAGKTYRLTAYATLDVASSAGAELNFVWRNAANTDIGNYGILLATNSNITAAGQGIADVIYTPTTNTTVSVFVNFVGGTVVLRGSYTNAIVTQIGSSAIVNPWVLSGNDSYNITGNVGIGTATPNASALLDMSSSTKGILIPRMTASQRNSIPSPTTGLLIFQTDASTGFYYYNGSSWVSVSEPNWTSAGTIQSVGWGATTTAPTIGAATVNDYIYKQLGAKTWKCQLTYSAGGSSAGVNIGSGDYLFTLPNGLQFNTSLAGQEAFTDLVGSSSWYWPGRWLSNSSGSITNLNQGGLLYVVPYSSTQFRLIHVGIAGVGALIPYASGYYGVGGNISWRVTFTFQSL